MLDEVAAAEGTVYTSAHPSIPRLLTCLQDTADLPRHPLLPAIYISHGLHTGEEASPKSQHKDNKDIIYFHNQLQERRTFQIIPNGKIFNTRRHRRNSSSQGGH